MPDPGAERFGQNFGARIGQWLRAWGRHAEALDRNRYDIELERMAADLGVSGGDLNRLFALGPNAAAQLPHMMQALDLDPAETPVKIMRDLQRVCSLCDCKTTCAFEIIAGSADTTYEDYCPNADTLRALQLSPADESPRRATPPHVGCETG